MVKRKEEEHCREVGETARVEEEEEGKGRGSNAVTSPLHIALSRPTPSSVLAGW